MERESTYFFEFICPIQHVVSRSPANVGMEGDLEGLRDLAFGLELMEVLKTLRGGLDLGKGRPSEERTNEVRERTLIAMVRMTAITSREPLRTRLLGRAGSYSQIAVAFSIAANFVM
jgi:hypothetical protein